MRHLKRFFKRREIRTLFLRMISEALSRDWMQADKASWDKPWKTALWNRKIKHITLNSTKNIRHAPYHIMQLFWLWMNVFHTKRYAKWQAMTHIYTPVELGQTNQCSSDCRVPHAMQVSRGNRCLQAWCLYCPCVHMYTKGMSHEAQFREKHDNTMAAMIELQL